MGAARAGAPDVLDSVAAFSAALDRARSGGLDIGLVPTMGALHAGHRSLIERAVAENGFVAVTVFVNPLQFGDPDDIAHYPRTLAEDLAVCREAGAALVFAPPVEAMYPGHPEPPATTVTVRGLTEVWEGASRPGHFDGVAAVVAKLFAAAGRCRAYFGEKDFQQLAVIRRMAADLSFPVEVVGCPTVRQPDGLALSSRNVRLDAAERAAAPVLARALAAGRRALAAGAGRPGPVVAAMEAELAGEPLVTPDYAAVVDARDLRVPATLDGPAPLRLLVAARLGPVRLIDNCDARPAAPIGGEELAAAGTSAGSADRAHRTHRERGLVTT